MISLVEMLADEEQIRQTPGLTPEKADRLFAAIKDELGDWSDKNLNTYSYTPARTSDAKPALSGLDVVQCGKYTALIHEG